jgi:hypothetical protein
MKVKQTSELIKASNSTIQRLVNAVVGAMKINSQENARPSVANQRLQVWWMHPTRQNIKNKQDACISTSFGQCLEENQRASVHVWRKIAHVSPSQTTQCIPDELPLHTLNSIDVCAIERLPHTTGVFKFWVHKGSIKGHTTTSSQTPALPKPFHQYVICPVLLPSQHDQEWYHPTWKFNKMTQRECDRFAFWSEFSSNLGNYAPEETVSCCQHKKVPERA